MLTIEDRPTFTMPVTVNTAAIQGTLTAVFCAHRVSEINKMEKDFNESGTGAIGFVKAVTASIKNVSFQGVRLPQTDDQAALLEALLDWPGVAKAMNNAYYKGVFEEREKNSPPLPSGS